MKFTALAPIFVLQCAGWSIQNNNNYNVGWSCNVGRNYYSNCVEIKIKRHYYFNYIRIYYQQQLYRKHHVMFKQHDDVNVNVNVNDDDVVVHIYGYTFTMNKTLKEEEKCSGVLYIQSDNTLRLKCDGECGCENGTADTSTACTTTNWIRCLSCNDGYHLVGSPGAQSCEANVCTCNDGTARTRTTCSRHNTPGCSSCNDGYHLNGSPGAQSCEANVCTCNDGTAGTGTTCSGHNTPGCSSCNNGYHLNGTSGAQSCEANTCKCEHGTAVETGSCSENDANECKSCDPNYRLTGNNCVAKTCKCVHGVAVDAGNCSAHNGNECKSCDPNYRLTGNDCVVPACVVGPNAIQAVCTCGTAGSCGVGASCASEGTCTPACVVKPKAIQAVCICGTAGSCGVGAFCASENTCSISKTLEPKEPVQVPTFRMTATESHETRKSTQRNNVTDADTLRDVSFDFSAPVSEDVTKLPPTLLNSDVYTLVFVSKMDARDYSISLLHFKDILSIRLENATAVCNVTLSDNTTLIVRTPPKVITTGWHHLLFKAVKFAESKLFGVQIYIDGIMVASKNTTVTLECAKIADRCQKPEEHGKFGPSQRVNLTVRSFLKFDTALPERQVEKQFLETDWIEKMTQSFTLHLTNLSDGEMDNYNRNETFLETVRDEGVTALFLALKNSKAEASLHLREEDIESSFAKICDANDSSCNVRRGVSRRLQHLTSGRSLVMEYKVSVRQKNKERLKRVMESWSASDTAFDRRLNKSLAALPPYVMVEKVQQSAVVAYPEDRYFESAKEAAERSLRATTSLTTQAPTTSAPNESSKPVHISSSNDTAWWVILLVALLIFVLLLVAVRYAVQWFITDKVQQKQTINKDFFARILGAWLSNPQSQLEWDAEVPKELFDVNPIRSVGTKSRAPSKTCATPTVPTSPFPSNS